MTFDEYIGQLIAQTDALNELVAQWPRRRGEWAWHSAVRDRVKALGQTVSAGPYTANELAAWMELYGG